MRHHAAFLRITANARSEQNHRTQRQPAADGVHHHRTCEIMELGAGRRLDPRLNAVAVVPGNAFEEGIDEADDHHRRNQLRVEFGAFGNAAGNNRRHRSSKRQQKKELGDFEAAFLGQLLCSDHERHAVGNAVTDEKIHNRRDRKIAEDFDQRIDLILAPHRAQFQKRKPRMHGQHHDCAQQNKQRVGTDFDGFHYCSPPENDRPS